MVNKDSIKNYTNYTNIADLQELTKENLVIKERENEIKPYKVIYDSINKAVSNGESDCFIDEFWFRHDGVKEFFINEGFTLEEPFTTQDIGSNGLSVTRKISWAVKK